MGPSLQPTPSRTLDARKCVNIWRNESSSDHDICYCSSISNNSVLNRRAHGNCAIYIPNRLNQQAIFSLGYGNSLTVVLRFPRMAKVCVFKQDACCEFPSFAAAFWKSKQRAWNIVEHPLFSRIVNIQSKHKFYYLTDERALPGQRMLLIMGALILSNLQKSVPKSSKPSVV